jgi:sugar phosphate isomerase/epimerase
MGNTNTKKMQFGFSTLGDGTLSYQGATELATRFGMDFLELRVLEGNLNLPEYFKSKNITPEMIARSKPTHAYCSSLKLTKAEPADIEAFYAAVELADRLNAPYVRVFGGGAWKDPVTSELIERGAKTLREVQAELKRRGLRPELLLETHDAFSSSTTILQLIHGLDTPLNIIWDTHHTWKLGGESPQDTWELMGPIIRHVHYKDSYTTLKTPAGYRFVNPGEGEYPTKALFHVLKANGYSAGVSLESEKHWRPEIPDLVDMLTAFTKIIQANI